MCAFSSYPVPLVELLEGQVLVPVHVPVIFRLSDPELLPPDPELLAVMVVQYKRVGTVSSATDN